MHMLGFGGYGWGMGAPWAPSVFFLLVAWGLFWKGLALWHSAQRKDAWWFIALLVLNTLGILEIVYIFFFAKLRIDELFSSKTRRS